MHCPRTYQTWSKRRKKKKTHTHKKMDVFSVKNGRKILS